MRHRDSALRALTSFFHGTGQVHEARYFEILASMPEKEQIIAHTLACGLSLNEVVRLLKPGSTAALALDDLPRGQIVGSAAGVTSLNLIGTIGAYQSVEAEVKAIQAAREVHIRIDSPGGNANSVLRMTEALQGKKVIITVKQAKSSAASLVQAGTWRRIVADGTIGIHKLCAFVAGDAEELRQAASRLDEIVSQHVELYARRIPKSEVLRWFDTAIDLTWDAQAALDAGLVDEIVDPAPVTVPEGLAISTPAGHPDIEIEDLLIKLMSRARGLFQDPKQFKMVIDAFAEREKNSG